LLGYEASFLGYHVKDMFFRWNEEKSDNFLADGTWETKGKHLGGFVMLMGQKW
jgi:hypothetical protein